MQGWRINMEDSHTHILSLPDDPGTAFFGVYDGHGGEISERYYLSVYFMVYSMEKYFV
jgi:protein phosphatase 2C family protein 2/3